MDPTAERKLMGFNLDLSTQDSKPYLSLAITPSAPRNREFDLNQVPSEKMEYWESGKGGGVGEVMGKGLALAPPGTTEDMGLHRDKGPLLRSVEQHHSSVCSNTSHNLQALDEVSTNLALPHIQTVSGPIAPRSNSHGLYWCEGCKEAHYDFSST